MDINDYNWFNDDTMYKYISDNQLEEFPDIIDKIKSLSKGQHKADIFRYYWLYLNGGIFMDDDLMIEKKLDFDNCTFISVKSYHNDKNLLFNGFIACSKFNPIIYKALKRCYITNNNELINNYHLFCSHLYIIYGELSISQNTFLLQEKRDPEFKEGVKSYYNNIHYLTHSTKIRINVIDQWKTYIEGNLLPIIKSLNVKLEGNIYSNHLSFNENMEMKDKQSNFKNILNIIKPKSIMEIGFNAGFSTLFMKMIVPDVNIVCIDLNEHKYVMPCFQKINSDFNNISIIPGSSYDVGLPKLINENRTFDIIHIDGDHRLEGAKKDLDLCIKLCHDKTIIIFDDTNLQYLDDLCTSYVNQGLLKDYYFKEYLNNQKYKHRFFQINKMENPNTELIHNSITDNINHKVPVYVSLTSIYKNQDILLQTLISIVNQSEKPDKIFLYLSEDKYLIDDGFKNKKITNNNLREYIQNNPLIRLEWIKNTGPYRKLLPILKEKWDDDCIIITIDDDTIYDNNLIENLVNDYNKHKCVIGYRGFTPSFDKIDNFNYYERLTLQNLNLYNFLTGKGGILYKPEFFHKTKDLVFNDKIYIDTCHTADDIWFYLMRILNNINCFLDNRKWLLKDNTQKGLFELYNSKNNTKLFQNTITKLKELNFNFIV